MENLATDLTVRKITVKHLANGHLINKSLGIIQEAINQNYIFMDFDDRSTLSLGYCL